jgi:hypothetical protein
MPKIYLLQINNIFTTKINNKTNKKKKISNIEKGHLADNYWLIGSFAKNHNI